MSDEHPWLKHKPAVIRKGLDAVSWDAAALYWAIQMYMGGTGADGVLSKKQLHVAAGRKISPAKVNALLPELFEEKLLEDLGDMVRSSHWEQPPVETWSDDVLRARWQRRKALARMSELCQAIKARDRHLCAYCGQRVNWADKKGRLGGTYDHVDPDGENTLDNVRVACRHCNGKKKDRTPEQAGMPLYRPGTTAASIADGSARVVAASVVHGPAPEPRARSQDLDPIQIRSGSGPDSSCAQARDGNEPDRARSDPDRTTPPHAGGPSASPHQQQSRSSSL